MTQRNPLLRTRDSDKRLIARCVALARRVFIRENWYRDLWLFAISIVVLWASLVGQQNAKTAVDLSHQIQQERRDATYSVCADQNRRHDATINQLLIEVRYYKKHLPRGTSAAQLQRSIDANISLINALAPAQDCKALAKRVTKN